MHTRLAFLMSALLTAAVPAVAGERLRIATEGAFPPWNFTRPSGELAGFDVDLAHELCRRMGAECEVVAQEWVGILSGLQQRKYDAVMAGMSITEERSSVVDFAGPYAVEPTVFAALRGSPLLASSFDVDQVDLSVAGVADRAAVSAIARALRGKMVAVQVATTQERLMQALFPTSPVRAYDTLENAALDLVAGRVEVLLVARSALDTVANRGITPFGPAFSRGVLGRGVGVAVRKGRLELVERFGRAIDGAHRDGTIAAISTRWFGFDRSIRLDHAR